jgi:hypothetical protein
MDGVRRMSVTSELENHPLAPDHFPFFVTPPGSTDVLFWSMAALIVLAVIGIGVFYFKLHSLPEQMAHSGQKVQFEIVAVLALLALFTHNHLFWVLGLLLALVPIPDFSSPLASMAKSLGLIAANRPATPDGTIASATAPQGAAPVLPDDAVSKSHKG